jgi:hypothetical protein
MVGAHTDSPNLRLKPRPDVASHGYRQLAVEGYGGLLLHTWLDRDLSLAGRVIVREQGSPRTHLVDFRRPLLRVPNLAIHLFRELAHDGLNLNKQQHAVPVVGLEGTPDLAALVARELDASNRRGRSLRFAIPPCNPGISVLRAARAMAGRSRAAAPAPGASAFSTIRRRGSGAEVPRNRKSQGTSPAVPDGDVFPTTTSRLLRNMPQQSEAPLHASRSSPS